MLSVDEDIFLEIELLRERFVALAKRDARREALIHAQEAMIRCLLAENKERRENAHGESGVLRAGNPAAQGL